ncbi:MULTISPECIES: DUF3592 domain-containing protein [unclassified Halomonas]|uniref:DUF3592 domain-containing protein n=1 Tax=unclassified Halomonas TaxID=2609666 RepID=UPI00207689E0|nr:MULTISPECIES: DUF3592 domain-containing protein [unclassified Halomonas]
MNKTNGFDVIKNILTPSRPITWIGVFLMVGAAALSFNSMKYAVVDRVKTYDWVNVDGKIENIEILKGSKRFKILYSYSFEGGQYTGNSIDPSRHNSTSLNDREINKVKTKFHNGEPISVFVNPENPLQSYYNLKWYNFYAAIPICMVFIFFILIYSYVVLSAIFCNLSRIKK